MSVSESSEHAVAGSDLGDGPTPPLELPYRRGLSPFVVAFAVYSLLTVFLTFPLVFRITSRIPKDLEDSLVYPVVLWWNANVMPLSERWWNGIGFFPADGMMAFSDHLLGASLIASPLQWFGASAIAAYNVTFLLSFPLCAIAGHALAFALTRRHDAAALCGLCYGFNPYRVGHLEHLELLLAYGMPLALLALHRFADTGRILWLTAFSLALALQALSTTYYALYFAVLFGLWLLWFVQPRRWRMGLPIVAAGAVAVAIVLPIAWGYLRIHRSYGLTRNYAEILQFSADVSSLVTAAPLSMLWGWTSSMNGGERQLFPGLTIVVLAVAGAVTARSSTAARDRLSAISKALWILAAGAAAVALGVLAAGPLRVDLGLLRASASAAYKPFSIAVALAALAVGFSPWVRAAFRDRSPLVFYIGAAVVMFLCCLGPEPKLFGERILYEPPYAWLMRLPFFSGTARVPARFGMLAILCLAVAGALAFARFRSSGRSLLLWALLALAILAEGWIWRMPLLQPPAPFDVQAGDAAAVIELPLGQIAGDTAAMYRATYHGKRTVNGYYGYEPRYYHVLRLALADHDPTVLDELARSGPILITAEETGAATSPWAAFVESYPTIQRLQRHNGRAFYMLPANAAPADACAGTPLQPAALFHNDQPIARGPLTDADPLTRWITAHPQQTGDTFTVDLGRVERPCRIVLSLGHEAELYPRVLTVETSDGASPLIRQFSERMGGRAVRAALMNPRDVRLSIPLEGRPARLVRLRLEQTERTYQWAVADVIVEGQTFTSR